MDAGQHAVSHFRKYYHGMGMMALFPRSSELQRAYKTRKAMHGLSSTIFTNCTNNVRLHMAADMLAIQFYDEMDAID